MFLLILDTAAPQIGNTHQKSRVHQQVDHLESL